MRPKHLSLWLAVQKFKWIDSKYRDDMTMFWLRILRRGLAVVLEPDLGEYGDSFHLDDFTDLLGSYNYRTSKAELRRRADKIIEHHPCGFDKISWPDCPDSIYDEYLELRNEKAFEAKAASDFTQKDLAKLVAWNLSQRWDEVKEKAEKNRSGDMTLRTLASEVFRHPGSGEQLVSPGTLSKWNKHVREET